MAHASAFVVKMGIKTLRWEIIISEDGACNEEGLLGKFMTSTVSTENEKLAETFKRAKLLHQIEVGIHLGPEYITDVTHFMCMNRKCTFIGAYLVSRMKLKA